MPFALLFLFLFMLYASPALLVPELGALRPTQLAGVSAMAVLTVQKAMSGERWRSLWPSGSLLLIMIGAAGLSSISAFWPRLAIETTLDFAKIGVVFLLILNCVDSERRVQLATLALIAGGVFPAAGTILNYMRGNVVEGNRAGWLGTFSNPNDLAYSVVLLIPLAFEASRNARGLLKPVFWVVLGLYVAAVFATHSRGGLIGMAAVLLVLGLRQRGILPKAVVAVSLVAVVVFAAFYWTRDAGFADLGEDFTVHQRMETIWAGLRMFADHPLVGVGLGCSVVAFPVYAPPNIDFAGALVIHNTAIEALSELGLVGFVPFVVLIISALYRARLMSRAETLSPVMRDYSVAFEASLYGFVVCGLSGGYVVSWFPYVVIGLIAALVSLYEEGRVPDEIVV